MIAVLSGVWLFHAFLLAATLAAPFDPRWVPCLLAVWSVKVILEVRFIRAGSAKLDRRKLLRYYPVMMPFHLLYVVLFPILGQILKPKWK